jgi:PAS domain S-box-containing protein
MVLHSVEGLHVPASLVLCRIDDAAGEARILVIGDPAEAIATVSYVSSIASNNFVIRMLHGCVDPVFLLDPRTRLVRECNPAAAALFGWSRREFIGADLRKLFPSEEAFLDIGKRLLEFESIAGIHEEEVLLKGLDQSPISCKLTSLCIFGPKGDAELRVAILHDITEAYIREGMLVRLATRTTELAAELTQLTKHQIPIGRESFADMGFTERQAQLARFAAIGLTSKEMAFRLGLSESTVKNHFSAMFRKFSVSSRIELIGLLSDRRILSK